jgi:hypothetical protein
LLILQAFLEDVWADLQSKVLEWSVIPPQKSNPLVLFQSINQQQQFKGISIQIRPNRSWTVFWDQSEAGSPESAPRSLQTIEHVIELLKTVEKSRCCPGITDKKYQALIGHTLQHAIVQVDPFAIHVSGCKQLIYKVFICVTLLKI